MDINVCQFNNAVDNKTITLCTEWSDNQVKLIIIRDDDLPLKGVISIQDLEMFAENNSSSKEDYFNEIKKELTYDNKDVQYYLTDKKFQWKKKFWKRGELNCQAIDDIKYFSQLMVHILPRLIPIKNNIINLNEENNNLKNTLLKKEEIIIEMAQLKNSIEDDLCRKFLTLLNMKKKRIKKLENKLSLYGKGIDEIYDVPTDTSDNETLQEPQPGPSKIEKLQSINNTKINLSKKYSPLKKIDKKNISELSTMGSLFTLSNFNGINDSSDDEPEKQFPRKKPKFNLDSTSKSSKTLVKTTSNVSVNSKIENNNFINERSKKEEITILKNPISKREDTLKEKQNIETEINNKSNDLKIEKPKSSLFNFFTNIFEKDIEETEQDTKAKTEESDDDFQLRMEDSQEDLFS